MRILILICLFTVATIHPSPAMDGKEILLQVDRNLAPESYEMYRKLINKEPDGTRKEFVLYTAKKGHDSMVALFLSPATDAGRATLRVDENMWLYIPEVGKPLRITSLQSVVGGIFNNSDLMRLEFSMEYTVDSVDEEEGGYLLGLKAVSDSVAYDRLRMWVDKTHLLPTKIEAYTASGMLVKTLRYKNIKDFGGGIVRPSVMETDSPLYVGYQSTMLFADIQPRDFGDEIFSVNYLSRVKELR